MAPDIVRKNLTFWGMVGGVMTALKLKEYSDEYRRVPDSEEGHVALHSPTEESGPPEYSTLDTEIPMPRPMRKRSKDCCVCCGMRCGLFWKAFGIVCLIVLGWQAVKLIMWLVTPSPTGLEGMPEFSKSLGCANAPHIYHAEETTWSVAAGKKNDHFLDLRHAYAVGTVTIDEASSTASDISLEMILRTDNKDLLDSVQLAIPDPVDISDGVSDSEVNLVTPVIPEGSCMRYDIVLRVPPHLKKLAIQTRHTSQLQFAPSAKITLDSLFVTMYGGSKDNMLLPHTSLQAKILDLEMKRGWLVGEVAIVESVALKTQNGDAVTHVDVHPVAVDSEATAPRAILETTTGAGRTDIFYISDLGAPHRPIDSKHRSSRNGDLYLTYKKAEFNGHVEVNAKSYTATGVQGLFNSSNSGVLPWVGDADGGDYLMAQSNRGWVGLYF